MIGVDPVVNFGIAQGALFLRTMPKSTTGLIFLRLLYIVRFMPIKDSAKKEIRKSARRRAGNVAHLKEVKTLIKEARELVADKKQEEARALVPKIYKAVDKATKKGVFKKNTAARKKSRISALIKRIQK